MTAFMLAIYVLKFFIPGIFSVLFRAFGLGYRTKKLLAVGLCLYIAYTIGLSSILIVTIGYGPFTHIAPLFMALGSMLVLVFSTDGFGKTIFLQMTQMCMTTTVSVLLNLARTVLGFSYPLLVLLLAVVFPLLYWFALHHWAAPLRFIADNVRSDLHMLVLIPLIVIVVVSLLPVYPADSFSSNPSYITLLMLAVEGIFFLFVYTLYRNLKKISAFMKDEMQRALLETEIHSYRESLEAARQARHDMHHHNALVSEFLKTGDVSGALAYLETNDRAIDAQKHDRFSSDPTANAVLRIFNRRAQANDVDFSATVDLPEALSLEPPEISSLLSNLLENAFAATENEEPQKRHASITAHADERGLLIEARNSTSTPVIFNGGVPVSKKPGGGTGTRSIAHIVERHGGIVRFDQKDGVFSVQIVMPMADRS